MNRAIVGLPICRDKEWHKAATGWATEAFAISGALRARSPLLRPFVYLLLGSRHRLWKHIKTANRILEPEIKRRRQEDEKRLDMLQWMIQGAKGFERNPTELTHKTLFLCLASVVSSSMGVTHAIFDLCTYPQYVEPLRQEIDGIIKEEEGWTLAGLRRMEKLDSFLRESQRVNHPGLCKYSITSNFTL